MTSKIVVQANNTVGANFDMTPTGTVPDPDPDPDPTGSVTGKITNKSTRSAVAGVKVEISNTSFTTTTNSAGVYTIANVPVGNYKVTATAKGYTSISSNITIVANRTTTANLEMAQTKQPIDKGIIRGRVTDSYYGRPIASALILINNGQKYAYSDRNGYFIINDVQAGNVTVSVSKYGYNTGVGYLVVKAGRILEVRATLVPTGYYYYNDLNDEIQESLIEGSSIEESIIESPTIELPVITPPELNF